jgi:hypothetical protein
MQYADDTIIMIQPYDLVIANLKFIMIYFKSMSGLRINFHKNKGMVLGTNNMENDKALAMLDWGPLYAKVAKRVDLDSEFVTKIP